MGAVAFVIVTALGLLIVPLALSFNKQNNAAVVNPAGIVSASPSVSPGASPAGSPATSPAPTPAPSASAAVSPSPSPTDTPVPSPSAT